MRKILHIILTLFASLTMVSAQNLLTDGSIDRTSVNGEGALQTRLAFSDWVGLLLLMKLLFQVKLQVGKVFQLCQKLV